MRSLVDHAEPHFDEWRKQWTLELALKGAFRTKDVLTRRTARQLRKWVRRMPRTQREAEFFAALVNAAVERDERIEFKSAKQGNIKIAGQKQEVEGKKETPEARRMAKGVEKRTVEMKVTTEPGDLSHAQCGWQMRRLARALQLGIKPKDAEHMGVLLGVKKLRSETRKRKVRTRKEDGTEELVDQTYEHPIFEELRPQDGPDDGPIPGEDSETMPEGFEFDERLKQVFSKGQMSGSGLPFAVSALEDSKVEVIFAANIPVEDAAAYVYHYLRLIPWATEPKGYTLKKELFGGGS